MKISFITATYNGVEFTMEMIKSFEATLPLAVEDFEFIIVDNNSTDGTREFLETLKTPPYLIIHNSENLGFAKANNQAARLASGELLVFLNNDLILTADWFEPMLAAFDAWDDVGAVGNIQLNAKTGLIDHAGVFFQLDGQPGHSRKGKKRIPKKQFLEWNAVTAACLLVRSALFEQVGGFDEAFINGSEDIDLCLKLRAKGFRNLVSTKSVIYHHVSASSGRYKYKVENAELFLQKWRACTERWGRVEWPPEYLARYADRFWRFNIQKLVKAVFLLFFHKIYRSESNFKIRSNCI
ncbi:MAG: glycosyltransferase [Verrucomicrobia bacterium]|jgi:GT2 family glycosyltransferase|nr:glycosyltransferase [Verrucomicrobiota bacterium]